jgi:hypothetical protein
LRRHPGEKAEIKPLLAAVSSNAPMQTLGKRRDFVVNHGALQLKSHGRIGTTEGATIKVVFPFAVYPAETSDEAYERYKTLCKTNKVLCGFGPDRDSAPALWRTWMTPQFPDRDLLDVTVEAWRTFSELLSDAIEAFGGEKLDLSLPCRHDPAQVQLKRCSQYEVFLSVDGIDLEEEERRWREQKAKV